MPNRRYAGPSCLLNYFGEFMEEGCDNCDNCLHPKEKFEGKADILLGLKAILGVKEKFKSEHIANILAGNCQQVLLKHTSIIIQSTLVPERKRM